MKRLSLICVMFVSVKLLAQQLMPALVCLDYYKQADSLGYNLVAALPQLLNKGVHDGSIPLWDSPKKEKNLSGRFIRQLEEANRTKFTEQQYLFLHELWSTTKRQTKFSILGLSLVGESKKDTTKFNYGYIDLNDISELLKTSYIPLNMNGSYHTTYWDALHDRKYNFSLSQLGHHNFSDLSTAANYITLFFDGRKKVSPKITIPEQKYVAGYLNKEIQNKYPEVDDLFKTIATHYQNNKSDFLNGIKKTYPQFDTSYLPMLTAIEFGSIWHRDGKFIITNPDYILLYFGDLALDTLSLTQISKWPVPKGSKPISELIKDSEFAIIITRINETIIPKSASDRFMQALRYSAWNKLEKLAIRN